MDGEQIVDEVAIDIAIAGLRIVALTQTERNIVTTRMRKRGATIDTIANHVGVRKRTISELVSELGI